MFDRTVPPYQMNDLEVQGERLKLATFIGDHISDGVSEGRLYEQELLDEILMRYGTGGVYYDFGAFVGTHSLYFAKVCKADLVVAVEPNPKAYELLRLNMWMNDCTTVELYNTAVGGMSGRIRLGTPDDGNVAHTVGVMQENYFDIAGTVAMYPAFTFVTAEPKIIKIDTEGWAVPIIDALRLECTTSLYRQHPVFVVEADEDELVQIMHMLSPLGYEHRATMCSTPTHIIEATN